MESCCHSNFSSITDNDGASISDEDDDVTSSLRHASHLSGELLRTDNRGFRSIFRICSSDLPVALG